MQDHPISRFPVPQIEDLPEDMRTRIALVREKLGFVPNVFLTLAHRPDEFRAFFAYFDALMLRQSGLSKTEKEMIVVATTAMNHCIYCVQHHSAILRIRSKSPLIADQVAINHRRADLSEREHAILEFAVKVTGESYALRDEDFNALRNHGLTEEDIWDVGAISAFFAHGSRMANFIGMRANAEFYALGRSL